MVREGQPGAPGDAAQADSKLWPQGAGEMARRVREHDWAATPLGPVESWPQSLKTTVDICLSSAFASYVWWGPDLIQLYNDAALAIVRAKHPAAFAAPAREAWSEVWDTVGPLVERVLGEAEPVVGEDVSMVLERGAPREPACFTFGYSPLRDEAGTVAGMLITAIETTGRARVEAALRESEASFRHLVGSWAQAAWETDAAGVVTTDSPSWRAYTGQSLEEWLGYGWLGAIHPDDRNLAERHWHVAVAARRNVDAEFRLRHAASGGWRWTKVHAAPLMAPDGSVRKWVGMNVDVHDRREAEERFRVLADVAPQLVWSGVGPDIDFFNRRWHDYTGLDEAASHEAGAWRAVVHPDDLPLALERSERSLRAGEPYEIEYRLRRADGSYRWHIARAHRVPGSERWVGAAADIHDLKSAQEGLRGSEERQAFLLRLSDALRAQPDEDAVADLAVRLLAEELGVDGSYVVTMHTAEDRADVTHQFVRPGFPPVPTPLRLSNFPEAMRQLYQQTQILNDAAQEPGLSDQEKQALAAMKFGAFVAATLRRGERNPVWAMVVVSAEPRRWTPGEIRLIEEVSERTWAAMQRARAEAALRESEARLAVELADTRQLHRISSRLIVEDNVDALYDGILEAARSLMHSEMASIQQLVPERQQLFLLAQHGFAPESAKFWEWVRADHTTACGVAFARGEPVIVPDVEIWDFVAGTEDLTHYRFSGIRAMLSTPLVSRDGRLIGVISTHWRDIHEPSERELRLLDVLARQAADLIERRATEAALRTSEEKYRTLFETMGQGYADFELMRDADGRAVDQRYLELNPAYERLIGIPVANAKGRTASAVMPELEDWWTETFDRIAERGEPERIEHEVASLGRWFEVLAYPRGGDRLTVLYEDITDRKRAEVALRASEKRQAFLLKLTDELRVRGDAPDIQATASRLLGEHLGADRAFYCEIEGEPGARVAVARGQYARRGDPLPELLDYEFLEQGWASPILYRGEPVVIADADQDPRPTAGTRAAWRAVGVGALIVVGLIKSGRESVNFGVFQDKPRSWSPAEVELVREVAERTWAAAERARAERALRASEERFRSFAETSADTLWIVDGAAGRLEYLSPAFEAMWGETRDAVMADLGRWAELVHPKDRERALQGLPRLLRGEVPSFVTEYRIVRPCDGAVRWIRDTGFLIRGSAIGAARRVGGIAQDVTESREAADRARASEARLRALVVGIPQLVWRAADGGSWTWSSPQWHAVTGLSDEASRGLGWLTALHPDDREGAMAAWGRAEASGAFEAEYRVRRLPEGRYRWFQTRATPVRDGEGRIVEWLGTSTDVDDLRALQERQRLLLAELQHRVRNTLGVVRSIARRTAATSSSVEDLSRHLDGRLGAFARTQAMVTRDPAAGIDLELLLAEELLAHTAHEGEQVRIAGPKVRFYGRAAETMGLAVHELATNAVKHGALARSKGRIEIRWRVEADDGAARLRIVWSEAGGPPPPPARHRGFGAELLERTLAYELRAVTHLAFEPKGLRCTINLPLSPQVSVEEGVPGVGPRYPVASVPGRAAP